MRRGIVLRNRSAPSGCSRTTRRSPSLDVLASRTATMASSSPGGQRSLLPERPLSAISWASRCGTSSTSWRSTKIHHRRVLLHRRRHARGLGPKHRRFRQEDPRMIIPRHPLHQYRTPRWLRAHLHRLRRPVRPQARRVRDHRPKHRHRRPLAPRRRIRRRQRRPAPRRRLQESTFFRPLLRAGQLRRPLLPQARHARRILRKTSMDRFFDHDADDAAREDQHDGRRSS